MLRFAPLLIALFCGCSKQASIPAASKPIPARQFEILAPAEMLSRVAPSNSAITSFWSIQVAQFHEHQIEDLGLARLFSLPLRTNGVQSVIDLNPAVGLSRADTNVLVGLRLGAHVGVCSNETAARLIQRLSASAGVDLLTTPYATLVGTQPAQVAVQDSVTLVLPSISPTTNLSTTKLLLGQVFDLRLLGMHGSTVFLRTAVQFVQFKGYTNQNSDRSSPLLNLGVCAADLPLDTNQTLLLGTPIDTSLVQWTDRVRYLADIPLFGKLFTKSGFTTNYLRQVVFIRRIDPDADPSSEEQ